MVQKYWANQLYFYFRWYWFQYSMGMHVLLVGTNLIVCVMKMEDLLVCSRKYVLFWLRVVSTRRMPVDLLTLFPYFVLKPQLQQTLNSFNFFLHFIHSVILSLRFLSFLFSPSIVSSFVRAPRVSQMEWLQATMVMQNTEWWWSSHSGSVIKGTHTYTHTMPLHEHTCATPS